MDTTYLGKPFRQISARLRIRRGPGRPYKESSRPRNQRGDYLDSDEQPTLITFDEFDQVDFDSLLAIGAIVPWEPPKLEPKPVKPKLVDPGGG